MTVVGNDKSAETAQEKTTDASQTNPEKNVFDTLDEQTEVPASAAPDSVMKAAAVPGVTSGTDDHKETINHESYAPSELIITSKEKQDFVDAMITGARYTQQYSIFGGKISVVIRSRTTDETQAMYAYIRRMLLENDNLSIVEGDMSYLLLVTQIEEINGTKFPEMKAPLTFVEDAGNTIEPGWVADLQAWKKKPEGLTSALINRVQLFEYKYWMMVKEASNKNFWNSDTSLEK